MAAHARLKEINPGDRCRIYSDKTINASGIKNGSLCTVRQLRHKDLAMVQIRNSKKLYPVHIDYLKKVKEPK